MVAQTQANPTANTPPTGKLVLGAEYDRVTTILVKFTFKDPAHVPASIPRIERMPDYEMDRVHQQEQYTRGKRELGRTGRVREGRVDTGTQVISTRRPTQAALIRRGLANNDFSLLGLHCFEKEGRARHPGDSPDPQYVVCAAFTNRQQNSVPGKDDVEGLRALARMTWQNCHVWDNPNGVATINFVGLQNSSQKAKQAITVRNGDVVVLEVADHLSEEQE